MTSWSRPLPLAIALMVAVAASKVAGLVQGVRPADVVAQAVAAPDPGRPPTPARAAQATPPHAAPAPRVAPPAPVVPTDPPASDAERSLLQDLRGRRVAIDAREQALTARESLLAAAEQRLSARVEELQALQNRLETLEAARHERDEANWRGLVRTYEAMRPKDAAAIFAELDQAVLMQVLDRMKDAKAAPILSAMPPDRARAITAELAQMRIRSNAVPSDANHG